MISKIPIDTDKKIIERYEKRADFTVIKLLQIKNENPKLIPAFGKFSINLGL